MTEKTLEERVEQLEKEIIDISFTLKELLTWKRNQATRQLPSRPYREP